MAIEEKRPKDTAIFWRASYVASVGVACTLLGASYAFSGGLADRTFVQKLGDGLAVALFLAPFLAMSLGRALQFLSPWSGLALLTATCLAPVLFRNITGPSLRLAVPFVFVLTAFMLARWLERRFSR